MANAETCKTIDCLRQDHAIIGRFLGRFKIVCQKVENLEELDFSLIRIVTFVDDFIETFHHAREEKVLFDHLERKNRQAAYLGRRLTHDHMDGRHHLEGMRKSAAIRSREERASFLWNAVGYAGLSRDHMSYEERELYPHVASLITQEDDEVLMAKFGILFPDSAQRIAAAEEFVNNLPAR